MNPEKVQIQKPGQRHQSVGGELIDADLRHFVEKDVAGMDVYDHIGAAQILKNIIGGVFRHASERIAGENAVHVEVEAGQSAGDGIDAQRIEGGIDVHGTVEFGNTTLQQASYAIADVLTFEFIAVRACHYADSFFAVAAGNAVLENEQMLIDGKFRGNNGLDHGTPTGKWYRKYGTEKASRSRRYGGRPFVFLRCSLSGSKGRSFGPALCRSFEAGSRAD